MFKIKIHSVVDIITNSSTVIYTWHDDCVQPVKEMITEFLKVFDIDKKVEDLFYVGVFLEDTFMYDEVQEMMDDPIELSTEIIEDTMKKVISGEIERPNWMVQADNYENYNGMTYSTAIYIEAKDPKYKALGDKIKKIIYAVEAEECPDC